MSHPFEPRELATDIGMGERPTAEPLLQFFAYQHLPTHLQQVSKPFCELASRMVGTLPANQERTAALRKLLEAKDCAVRALLFKEPQDG